MVFTDRDRDGQRDSYEAWAVTDANGRYRIEGLAPDTYRLALEDFDTTVGGVVVTSDAINWGNNFIL